MFRVAVGQMCATGDVAANLAAAGRLAKRAAEAGATLLSLPECFDYVAADAAASVRKASSVPGPVFDGFAALAREHGLFLALGGFHERLEAPGMVANTHALVDPQGRLIATYRKAHLFDVDTADGAFHESSFTAAGAELVAVDVPGGVRVGLTTCYDLRFPAMFAALRAAGSNLLLVPSAFMVSTGRAHWETLLRARAIETQCYVAAAAQCGKHEAHASRVSYGHSLIIDPWGEVVARLGGEEKEGLAVADLDLELVDSVRRRMPVLQHARHDLYASQVHVAKG